MYDFAAVVGIFSFLSFLVEIATTPAGGAAVGNSSALIGNVVNRAGSLFSNFKDASSKMMSSVAGYVLHCKLY